MQQLIELTQAIIKEHYILLEFNREFEQEDAHLIKTTLLNDLPDSQSIEDYEGADRASFRIKVNHFYCVLHFEVYSQSCWIEAEAESEISQLHAVHQILVRNLN